MRLLPLIVICLALVACEAGEAVPEAAPDTTTAAAPQPVRTGADVIAEEGLQRFEGQRLGLVVNHTATAGGTHLADLVHEAEGVELGALFGPEHGIRGTASAGEKVEGGTDEATGAPIYSLYGSSRQPTPEQLEGLDALVFDVQDVGARFYTYIATMGLAMQAAAREGIPFYVLDRPNPLGGERVAGFMLEDEQESFVGPYPIPIQHGLTVGEMARMIQGEGWMSGLDGLDLRVVEMEGWERSQLWPDTGLDWVPPSPNLPTFASALVYPGTALFEGTRASEGRGTDAPFQLLGAPWADGAALAGSVGVVPGVQVEGAQFTPEARSGAASPKLEGRDLGGVRVEVTDAEAVEPVALGVRLLHAFYHAAPDQQAFLNRDWLAKLAGTERLVELLHTDATPAEVEAAWQDEAAAFEVRRRPYLLYD